MSAAAEYKAIMAQLTAAADALRVHDRDRATQLAHQLGGLERAVRSARERAALTRFGVELHWEAALEALWPESWLKLRPRPGPSPRAVDAGIDDLDAQVAEATDALLEAVRRSRFGLPRR